MRFAEKLFVAFHRLHGPGEFEGSGIGLATVRRIVGRHGGQVWAESEPGKGATFFFTLGPRLEERDRPCEPRVEAGGGRAQSNTSL